MDYLSNLISFPKKHSFMEKLFHILLETGLHGRIEFFNDVMKGNKFILQTDMKNKFAEVYATKYSDLFI